MKRSVLIVSHADADGHLIAEQVRRNLALIDAFDVRTVVDSKRTQGHRSWLKLDDIPEIDRADLIFFMDLMFGPSSFAEEAESLAAFVRGRPEKRFFLVDHHPLPLQRLSSISNLHLMYRPEVFECAIGPRSGMMIVAALCEKQSDNVADIAQPVHQVLARGMRWAAALGGDLPGEKLMALLRSDRWDDLVRLGSDAPEYHRLPRGRRPKNHERSATLKELDAVATQLLERKKPPQQASGIGSGAMPYDMDVARERFSQEEGKRTRVANEPKKSRDLEAIVTLIEVASLALTTHPGATFTRKQLIDQIHEIAGDDIEVEDGDVNIVLQKAGFLKRVAGGLSLK